MTISDKEIVASWRAVLSVHLTEKARQRDARIERAMEHDVETFSEVADGHAVAARPRPGARARR